MVEWVPRFEYEWKSSKNTIKFWSEDNQVREAFREELNMDVKMAALVEGYLLFLSVGLCVRTC